ncbi:MAG: HD domain-containing protein [Pseudomonadota bacterium]
MQNGVIQGGLPLILEALDFSACKHKDQRRKDVGASPYINHPIALAKILCIEGRIEDSTTICAALLHDTLEDTETTPGELTERFGPVICSIVQEVTDNKTLSQPERKKLQIEHAKFISPKAQLVKLADKIANLRDLADASPVGWDVERRREYFDWANSVINQLRGRHEGLERLFDAAYAKKP